jgi:16S rRNA (guanine527-N7)-methyltransferase
MRRGLVVFDLPEASGGAEVVTDKLVTYLAELHKWNRAYNLTAVRDPDQMLTRHVFDSLIALPWVTGQRLADVGTGAGLPGIPLAVCHPDKVFTLIDSNGKKTRFVEHAVARLGLDNVMVVQARAESFAPTEPFDSVFSRAFASLAEFVTSCGGLLEPDGRLVAMKGRYPDAEIAALPAGWSVESAEPVTAPGQTGERHIVVLAHD